MSTLLFSYGSNNVKQLTERVGQVTAVGPGYLPNHVRVFAGYSERWKGAVACVYKRKDCTVQGVIVQVRNAQLNLLDRYEYGYTRHQMGVYNTSTGTLVPCEVYVKNDTTWVAPPSPEYIAAIRTMLNEVPRAARSKLVIRGIVPNHKAVPVLHIFGRED
jgi:hypothetical protein